MHELYARLNIAISDMSHVCCLALCYRENGVGYLDLTQPQDPSPIYANLIKSDGSTLYLTRYTVLK